MLRIRISAGPLAFGLFVCVAPSCSAAAPELAVVTASDNTLHIYAAYAQVKGNQSVVEDAVLRATVTNLGNNIWRLDITAKRDLKTVSFPWQSHRISLDDDISDDYYYYPYLLGMTEKATAHNADWTWWGLAYPGETFAPLTVMADKHKARIVAAVNWPPKRVSPRYAAERMILQYDTGLATATSASYQALIAEVTGDADSGTVPWQLALDRYRAWLDSKLPRVAYPDWMWRGEGFLNIQLQNLASFDAASLDRLWQPIKTVYPWVLFWGQMGPYAGAGGGCCLLKYQMDPRYQPGLPKWVAARISADGAHAGYYSAPHDGSGASDPRRFLDTEAGVTWLKSWLEVNRSYGANSYYIDTLARGYHGNPAAIMELFSSGTISRHSLLEGVVDIYPAAGLVSGALVGTHDLCGAPQKKPENTQRTTFPRFGRYLLGDRLIYEGGSNTDWRFWGSNRSWLQNTDGGLNGQCGFAAYCSANGPCEHGTEYLAFLLGAKLDVIEPQDNPVLDAIVKEHQRVSWWSRGPVYLDTKELNLTAVPIRSAVQVARFRDSAGKDLIAFLNPRLETGVTVSFRGKAIPVPNKRVSIYEIPANLRRLTRDARIPTGHVGGDGSPGKMTASQSVS
jgi:hypothetical protein